MNNQGKLIVISAPSGCGKTTIVGQLLERNPKLIRSISYTTRLPRAGEVNGRDYFFITPDEFQDKEKKNFFLETANVFGQLYGTSREFVRKHTDKGTDVVLAIDVQGMKQLKKRSNGEFKLTSIFIMPPSEEILRGRLENRKTETKEEITKRLDVAHQEILEKSFYDFVVVNHEVDQAVQEIEHMIGLRR